MKLKTKIISGIVSFLGIVGGLSNSYAAPPAVSHHNFDISQKATEWMLFLNMISVPTHCHTSKISRQSIPEIQLTEEQKMKILQTVEESKMLGIDKPICLGKTLLHYAADLKCDYMVKRLLEAGANPYVPSVIFGTLPDFTYLTNLYRDNLSVASKTPAESETSRHDLLTNPTTGIILPRLTTSGKRPRNARKRANKNLDSSEQLGRCACIDTTPGFARKRLPMPTLRTQYSCRFNLAHADEEWLREFQAACGKMKNGFFIPTPPGYLTETQKRKIDALIMDIARVGRPIPIKFGRTPLHYAAIYNCTYMIEKLLEVNPEYINIQNCRGNTALHTAIYYGRNEAVETLLSKGADLKIKNNVGNIPLIIAIQNGRSLAPNNLIKLIPADYTFQTDSKDDFKNFSGQTPYTFAEHYKKTWLIQILKQLGNEHVPSELQPASKRREVTY